MTGEPRRFRGSLSLALPGLLSVRVVPGSGRQALTWLVRWGYSSGPMAGQIPPQSPLEAGGPLLLQSQETPWREGCSSSCWDLRPSSPQQPLAASSWASCAAPLALRRTANGLRHRIAGLTGPMHRTHEQERLLRSQRPNVSYGFSRKIQTSTFLCPPAPL